MRVRPHEKLDACLLHPRADLPLTNRGRGGEFEAGMQNGKQGLFAAFPCVEEGWAEKLPGRLRGVFDIRGRAEGREFDPWVVERPPHLEYFAVRLDLRAAWIADVEPAPEWPALPDLEAHLSWPGGAAVVPVLFLEKHTFPVVEARQPEDERALPGA